MVKMSNELKNEFASVLVNDIGTKVIDGITYVLFLNAGADSDEIKRYGELIKKADNLGISRQEAISAFKVANGCIFDMNMQLAKQLSYGIIANAATKEGVTLDSYDMVKNGPEQRREDDIQKLAEYLNKEHKNGKREIQLALYSRNKVDKIEFAAKRSNNSDAKVIYQAFAVRHWDLNRIGDVLRQKYNISIKDIKAGEILPTKTGVRFCISLN